MTYTQDLEKVGRQLFPFYIFIIFIAPIPYGSNRIWAWGVLAFGAFTLLTIYLWKYSRGKVRSLEFSFDTKLILILFITWFLYQVVQLIPLPVEFLEIISPNTLELKRQLIGGSDFRYLPVSIDVSSTRKIIFKSAMYICMFILTLCLIQSRERLRILIFTIVAVGVVQSVWGMGSAFIEQELLFNHVNENKFKVVNGTFINRNHFGGFMNLAIAGLIGLLLASGLKEKRQIHRDRFSHHWQSRVMDWRVYLIPYFGLMLFALILSQSRGAFFSFICMLFILMISLISMKVGIKQMYSNFKMPILVVIFILIFSSANFLSSQVSTLDSSFNSRIDHWANSLAIFENFKLMGVGAGNFQHIFPLYDSGVVASRLIHAHNDYLEILVEQGIIGFSLLALIVLICIKNAIQAIKRHTRLQKSAYAIASLIAISGFLIHSTIDFNFQIPSNAMYFFIYLAIALLQGMNSVHKEKRETVWDEEIFNDSSSSQNSLPSMSIRHIK